MNIILADDDPAILQTMLAILQQLPGHEVRTATAGGLALQAATAMGGVDLLITDVVMEPMNGLMLRDAVVKRFPSARVIFISGYDLSDYAEKTQGNQVLQKPFEPADLIAAVEREIGAAAQPVDPTAPVPVAVPRAAVAQPVAQPRAVAAQPRVVAVPVATPRVAAGAPAVKVAAQPRAVAAPTAQPRAVAPPTAQPRAVAAAPSVPTPRATPTAPTSPQARPGQPRVAAQPQVSAQPRVAAAVPVAVPRPAVAAVPTPVVPPPQPVPPPTETADGTERESLIGATLGAYQIVSQLGEGRWGRVYAAVQIAINRPVGLKVLDTERASDETQKSRFIADARAKAHVQHPSILSVYEAGEVEGRIFYAHEFVDGHTLAEYQASGQKIDEAKALKILRSVGDALAYLQSHNIPHSALDSSSIYLGLDGVPHLANLATQIADQQLTTEQELQALGRIMLSVLPSAQTLSPGLRALLSRMVQVGPSALNGWGALLQGVKALEPKVVPVEAAKISAQDRAAIEAVEAARKAERRSLWLTVASMSLTLLAVIAVIWWKFFTSNERILDVQIEIPAGEYITSNGTVSLGAFWIDKYEITIGQYAKFLTYLEKHPTAESELNHPKQPRQLGHMPDDWAIYYGQAKATGAAHSVPMSLNSPAFMITWWDAYAYAKWKGRELPTEDEWEAAARGPKGLVFPWGNELDTSKVNSNADFNAREPGAKGKVDGFSWWGDVDLMKGDRSPFDVIGMAGNVSEWIAWPDKAKFPLIKGGNFSTTDVRLDKKIADHDPSKAEEFIGFRTISRTPPVKR